MRVFLLILLFVTGTAIAQVKKHVFENKQVKVEYQTKNGMFDGKYVSYYASGKKKAEGFYKDNLRTGKWEVWDSAGKRITHTCKAVTKERNGQGFFDYTFLKQEDVLVEKRVWRDIHRADNPLLFTDPSFFDVLYDAVQQDSLVVYKDDEFMVPRTKEYVRDLLGSNYYMIDSYKEKEDWFFDKKINACNIRPVGLYIILAPRGAAGEATELGWVCFPQLRKILAAQKIWDKLHSQITNLDDLFWYRYFASQIYKETNIYDRSIASYAKTPEEAALEAERIEIDMIEYEHSLWLYAEKALPHGPK